mmetsp:Transcript_44458/g.95468  ORF Transcript_44458/g.95468 Transcript_44458/m.95468 type:complete len:254 (-) Transcript_44458:113-874(-)
MSFSGHWESREHGAVVFVLAQDALHEFANGDLSFAVRGRFKFLIIQKILPEPSQNLVVGQTHADIKESATPNERTLLRVHESFETLAVQIHSKKLVEADEQTRGDGIAVGHIWFDAIGVLVGLVDQGLNRLNLVQRFVVCRLRDVRLEKSRKAVVFGICQLQGARSIALRETSALRGGSAAAAFLGFALCLNLIQHIFVGFAHPANCLRFFCVKRALHFLELSHLRLDINLFLLWRRRRWLRRLGLWWRRLWL